MVDNRLSKQNEEDMSCPGLLSSSSAVLAVLFCSALVHASTTIGMGNASRALQPEVPRISESVAISESLRRDVANHPNDFVTFATKTAAMHFLEDHGVDAYRETVQRLVDRGVIGYWRGKTVVVVPIVPSTLRGGL